MIRALPLSLRNDKNDKDASVESYFGTCTDIDDQQVRLRSVSWPLCVLLVTVVTVVIDFLRSAQKKALLKRDKQQSI